MMSRFSVKKLRLNSSCDTKVTIRCASTIIKPLSLNQPWTSLLLRFKYTNGVISFVSSVIVNVFPSALAMMSVT